MRIARWKRRTLLHPSCTAIDAAWATRASTSSVTAVATRYCLQHVRTAAKSTPTTRSFAARADTSSGRRSRVHRDASFGSQSKVQHSFGVEGIGDECCKECRAPRIGPSDLLFTRRHTRGSTMFMTTGSQVDILPSRRSKTSRSELGLVLPSSMRRWSLGRGSDPRPSACLGFPLQGGCFPAQEAETTRLSHRGF